uniref:Uncharacterized protein n=1 Tax=Macrostomum lignano TaxID=282301 RepID=A0A1I8FUK5_9PLAT
MRLAIKESPAAAISDRPEQARQAAQEGDLGRSGDTAAGEAEVSRGSDCPA